jgi:hypothetical protein
VHYALHPPIKLFLRSNDAQATDNHLELRMAREDGMREPEKSPCLPLSVPFPLGKTTELQQILMEASKACNVDGTATRKIRLMLSGHSSLADPLKKIVDVTYEV